VPPSRRAAVLAAVALLGAAVAPAGGAELTLRAAVEQALARHPLLEAARQDRAQAEAGLDRARAAWLPRLEGSYGYARSDQPVYAFGSRLNQGRFTQEDFDVGRLNDPGALDNFRAAVTLHQPLYTGGRATLGVERARIDREVTELEASRTRQEVLRQAAGAYYALRLAQDRLGAVDAAVRAAEANEALADTRVRAGLAVESDRLAAEVRLARLREDALTARGQVEVARAALNEALGAPLDDAVEAADPLALADGPPDLGDDALERRPDFRALRLQEEARERDVRLARATFLPTIGLEGTYEVNTGQPFADGQGSWSVGAVLRWNFLAGGADRARVREAEAARQRARAVSAHRASLIGLEVRSARARLEAARARVAVAERAVGQADETLRVVRVRYRGGVTTIVDLLGAEAAATDARLRLHEALYDQAAGRLAWEFATGRLSPESFR
jgi:outer membrane protein